MNGPFDDQAMDETEAASDDSGEVAEFEESDAGNGIGADLFAGEYDEADETTVSDAADQSSDLAASDYGNDVDDLELWSAFEDELIDGLDADDEDEFLGRILGGLGRAAGVIGREMSGAARTAGTVSQVAGRATPAVMAAARLAGMLGAPGLAGGLRKVAGGARQVQGIARSAGHVAGSLGGAVGGAQGLIGQLARLVGASGDELDDFDAVVDMMEEGLDEALPAAVALAARAAARGLGFRNVAKLSASGRRALVRGVAAAARELVRSGGAQSMRVLPRLAQATSRVAARSSPTPGQAAQAVHRRLPRATRRIVRSPRTMRGLAQRHRGQSSSPALARDPHLGRGRSSNHIRSTRTFYIDGPVALTVTPR